VNVKIAIEHNGTVKMNRLSLQKINRQRRVKDVGKINKWSNFY